MNARYGLWITAFAVSPLLFAGCGDDEEGDGGKGGSSGSDTGGSAGEAGSTGTGGTPTGGAGGRGGTAGTAGSAGTAGTMGGEGGLGGEGGMGGSGAADPGGRKINMTPARFFPEGVALDRDGNFYLGSMYLGLIYKANAWSENAAPFIPGGASGLVSVLGMYAEDGDGSDANPGTLWVCSSDAGNGALTGTAPVQLMAFNLKTGAFVDAYGFPEPADPSDEAPVDVNGFCNDMTLDADGNVYVTDSWYSRILVLPKADRATATELDEWIADPVFGDGLWHLNGIDVDQATRTLYVVENHPGHLWSIPINTDGTAGDITEIETSRPLGGPDGLKVVAPNLLATAESNGVSLITIDGDQGEITEIFQGLDGYATIALHQGSVWVVENQGDHFWDPLNAGPDADPPFRLLEVPLPPTVGAGARNILTNVEHFFSEGSTVDADGNLYVGSMQHGSIHRAAADDEATEEFIAPGTGGLVSVIGMYAHSPSTTLWVCSSDTDSGYPNLPAGTATSLKSFNLTTGASSGSWAWPAPTTTPYPNVTANGFCNDITRDSMGRIYATDSWYPRIVRLPANAMAADTLTTWYSNDVFSEGGTGAAAQWHLNGIDIEGTNLYVVANHPGHLWRLTIATDGSPGTLTEITTSRPLRNPDGLKVVNPTTLAVGEGSGMALITLSGNTGLVRTINTGLDGIATFALLDGSAWIVENQGDHFWGSSGPQGPNENKPFRLVEVPLALP